MTTPSILSDDFSSFIGGNYQVVSADPPWSYYGDPDKDQAAAKHYPCMTDAQLAALPVKSVCAKDAVLFMWVTCPLLDRGMNLLKEWGFHFRGVAYIWVKTTNDGKVIGGQGVRPSFVKPTTEMVLVGSTRAKGRALKLATEGQHQVLLAPRPGNVHSAKPKEIKERMEKLFEPHVKRLEMFARQSSDGCDAFGNQIDMPL